MNTYRLTFGKHKGKDIYKMTGTDEVRYLFWLRNTELKGKIKMELDRRLFGKKL